MGVAVFDYAAWVLAYPEFATVPEATATGQFDTATLFLDNTDCSPVTNVATRLRLLNMITAHLVKLFVPVGGVAPGGLVGRVSSATEGSVTVSAEFIAAKSQLQAFWNQTPYGALYWAAMSPFRTMRYIPGPTPFLGAGIYSGRRGWPQ